MNRKNVFPLISIAIGVLISIVIAETYVRIQYFGPKGVFPSHINSFQNLFSGKVVQKSNKPNLSYELIPNNSIFFKGVSFITNKNGQRDRLYQKDNTQMCTVGIFGDSFTMGTGVEEKNIYHAIAEQKLNEPKEVIHLINYGVSGYNFKQYIANIKHVLLKDSLDKIIIGFCKYNDHFMEGLDYPKIDFKQTSRNNLFVKSHLKTYINNLLKPMDTHKMYTYLPRQINYLDSCFKSINEITHEKDIPVLIYLVGVDYHETNSNMLKQLAHKNNLLFADGTKNLEGQPLKEVVLSPIDSHPNNYGHKLLSINLISFLKNHWLNR